MTDSADRPQSDRPPISQTPWSTGLQDLQSWEREQAERQRVAEGIVGEAPRVSEPAPPDNPFTRQGARRGRAADEAAPAGDAPYPPSQPRRSATEPPSGAGSPDPAAQHHPGPPQHPGQPRPAQRPPAPPSAAQQPPAPSPRPQQSHQPPQQGHQPGAGPYPIPQPTSPTHRPVAPQPSAGTIESPRTPPRNPGWGGATASAASAGSAVPPASAGSAMPPASAPSASHVSRPPAPAYYHGAPAPSPVADRPQQQPVRGQQQPAAPGAPGGPGHPHPAYPAPGPGAPQPGPPPIGVPPAVHPEQGPPMGIAPQSYSASDLIDYLSPQAPVKSRKGLRGRLGLAPSGREQAEQVDEDLVRTPFDRPVTIMIANPKGGVGKTPTTLMLASAFGVVRGGGVVAWDNNELRGTMPDRSLSPHRRTVRDLLEASDHLRAPQSQFTDLSYFLNHQTSGKFHTLGSAQHFGHVISREDFEVIHGILTRYFQVVIVDTGNNEASPNWLAAAESADCLVVPTKWRKDSLIPAARMLETLQEKRSELLQRTVVVATNGPMDSQEEVRRNASTWFGGHQIVDIPTDPHIAEGGVIEYTKLRPRTKREMLRLAAQVARILADVAAKSPT